MLLGLILVGMFSVFQGILSGHSIEDLSSSDLIAKASPSYIRIQLFLSHLGMFLLPSLFYGLYIFGKKAFFKGFDLHQAPLLYNLLFGGLLLFLAYPLVTFAFYINSLIPMADWMLSAEQNVEEMLNSILGSTHSFMIVINVMLIALMPAIGEELVFRGILQKNFERIFKNGHIAIWVAAIVFSGIHMQFEGFLARMVLGAIMGYGYYFTKNLWVPITMHFLNNLIPVIAFMMFDNDLTNTDNLQEEYNWFVLILPLLGVPALIIFWKMINNTRIQEDA